MDSNEKALHGREAFQLERLILFTDAVFAIAITLLVVELKIPELEHRTEHEALNQFLRLIPKLVGFFIIAIHWVAHHRIFRFVRHLNAGLIWLNMVFLLCIVLMPFTTAYQSEYGLLRTPWIIYSINISATGLMQARLQSHPRNPAHDAVAAHERPHPDLDVMRPLTSPIVFGLSILLSFFVQPWLLRLVPAVAFPVLALLLRRRRRRLDQAYGQQLATRP